VSESVIHRKRDSIILDCVRVSSDFLSVLFSLQECGGVTEIQPEDQASKVSTMVPTVGVVNRKWVCPPSMFITTRLLSKSVGVVSRGRVAPCVGVFLTSVYGCRSRCSLCTCTCTCSRGNPIDANTVLFTSFLGTMFFFQPSVLAARFRLLLSSARAPRTMSVYKHYCLVSIQMSLKPILL